MTTTTNIPDILVLSENTDSTPNVEQKAELIAAKKAKIASLKFYQNVIAGAIVLTSLITLIMVLRS